MKNNFTSTPVHQYTSTPVHQYNSTTVQQYNSTTVQQYNSTTEINAGKFRLKRQRTEKKFSVCSSKGFAIFLLLFCICIMNTNLFAQPTEAEACANTTILTLHNKKTSDLISYAANTTSFFHWSYSNYPYLGTSMNLMQNQTFGSGSLPVGNTKFDIYIDGTFTVDQSFEFFYCTIYMGPNAHIIINRGSRLDINDCHLLCCHGALEFNMWQGITIMNGGSLKMNASLVEDAQIAVDAEDNSGISVSGNIFNRNTVGINLQGPTIMSAIPNIGTADLVSFIAENYFTTWHFPFAFTNTSTASRVSYIIAAAPYSQGQLNIGTGKIGHAGITINNIVPLINASNNTTFYLGTQQPQQPSLYQYLEYGIINENSNIKVQQSDFKDLHANAGSTNAAGGCAIFVKKKYVYEYSYKCGNYCWWN